MQRERSTLEYPTHPSPAADDTLANLATPVPPMSPDTSTMIAYDAFSASPTLYALPVVDADGRPVGILNRFKFLERLSRPFGRDLLTHQPIEHSMDPAPLIVDERVPFDQLSTMLLDDAPQYIFDGFIVTRGGTYLGIGTGYALVRALTERRQAALLYMAHHDSLTGAPNRQLFSERLSGALDLARREHGLVGLLYLDVDRLKVLNDNLGHAVGDAVLREVVARTRHELRSGDTVARLSGDEFAAILPDLPGPAAAEEAARRVLQALRAPYVLARHDFNVSCSIGVAVFPVDAAAGESLQRAADLALYEAKQFRNTVQRYTSEIQRTHPTTLLAYSSVRRALDEGRVAVHYQPQIRAGTHQVVGVEALVRWHDHGHACAPGDLIRLAEDAGLISSITERVLSTALPQVLEWKRLAGLKTLSLAVNVSSIELRDGAPAAMIARHLEQSGFHPGDLELEITETTAMLTSPSAGSTLNDLRALGVRVSVDDFGTGYSSLSRLQRLPVNGVKIDRTFVDGIEAGDSGALAQAIILMGHSLGLTVIGEGVETGEQLAFLESHGCDLLQGFHVARPMAAAECRHWLEAAIPGCDGRVHLAAAPARSVRQGALPR